MHGLEFERARSQMRKLFWIGPALLVLTSLLNFNGGLPTLINSILLITSIPSTIYFIVLSWRVSTKNDAD